MKVASATQTSSLAQWPLKMQMLQLNAASDFLVVFSRYVAALAAMVQLVHRRSQSTERAGEDRYRLLAENATDMITRHDEKGRVLLASFAAQQLFGAHLRSSSTLDLDRVNGSRCCCDRQPIIQDFAWTAIAFQDTGRKQLDPFALCLEPGTWKGIESADLALDFFGWRGPVDPCLSLVNLRRVSCPGDRLRLGRRRMVEPVDQRLGAKFR